MQFFQSKDEKSVVKQSFLMSLTYAVVAKIASTHI